jgi:predicted short-subunit dehydrogenase-like oxidoreductase (DUF2520 family)
MMRFSVVGGGRLGTALAFALTRKGWQLAVIADRDPAAARRARAVVGRGRASADIGRAARGVGVLFLCVPDEAVGPTARKLSQSGADWARRVVFHTSGLLPAAALEPLRRKGARVAALHPVRSFPEKRGDSRLFRGISWSVQGDLEAVRVGRTVVRRLGGRVFRVREEDKPLYHAACSLASNALVVLEAAAADLLGGTGISRTSARTALFPLLEGTLQNVKKLGWEKALTGPVARGDVRTVRRHLEALRSRPLEGEIYRALASKALWLVGRQNIPVRKVRALSRLLEGRRLPPRAGRRPSRRPAP